MTDSPLDSPEIYSRLDTSGLYDRIAGLPEQIAEAWRAARTLELPAEYAKASRVVVLGMGGSGIGGALMRALAAELDGSVGIDVVRGYRLPGSIDERALVFASSNSGNTEETVASFREAIDRGARCVAITTGGELLKTAHAHAVAALTFDWSAEPRSALGWSFASLLAICGKLGLIRDLDGELDGALRHMRAAVAAFSRDVSEAQNPAKKLASRLAGHLPVVIGSGALAPVAYRWRTQINENGKSWAVADELSEMNHNAPVGYGLPAALVPLLRLVFLRNASVHERIRLRIDLSQQQMAAAGIDVEVIDVPGGGATPLDEQLWAIQLGDMASYYLGLLNGADPSEVRALDWLKDQLKK